MPHCILLTKAQKVIFFAIVFFLPQVFANQPVLSTEQVAAAKERLNLVGADLKKPEIDFDLGFPNKNQSPTLPILINKNYVVYSIEANAKETSGGCVGHDVYAYRRVLNSSDSIQKEFLVASVPCVVQFFAEGDHLLIHSREGTERKDILTLVESIEPNAKISPAHPEIFSHHVLKLRFLLDLALSHDKLKLTDPVTQYFFQLIDGNLFILSFVSDKLNSYCFVDAYAVKDHSQLIPLTRVDFNSSPNGRVTDFAGVEEKSLFVTFDGSHDTLGAVYRLSLSASKAEKYSISATLELGANSLFDRIQWKRVAKSKIGFRHPRFLQAYPYGFVLEEQAELAGDEDFVLYSPISSDETEVFRLPHLDTGTKISGLRKYEAGLLVAFDEGTIRWYGSENPFEKPK